MFEFFFAIVAIMFGTGLTGLLIPYLRWAAVKYRYVDAPDKNAGGRKMHERPVPPVGGAAMAAVWTLLVLLIYGGAPVALLAAIWLVVIIGVIDEKYTLHAWLRFGVQLLAACLLVFWGGAQVHSLGNLFGFGEVSLGGMAIPFSLFCVVLLINAMNMLDGLDGLASGYAFIACTFLGMLMMQFGQPQAIMLWLMGGCLLGFLYHNIRTPFRARASVFMGDAGSMMLGVLLGWAAITSSQAETPIHPAAVAWLLTLPVLDTFALFIARLSKGKHPFSPDRLHIHYRILDRTGKSVGEVTALLLGGSFICGLVAVFIAHGLYPPLFILLWTAGGIWHAVQVYKTAKKTS